MRKESLAFLKELVNTPSPTSYETRGQRVWLDYVSQFADETHHDEYGNCVATLNKGGGPRIMLAGHADEIALSVNYIDDNGFITAPAGHAIVDDNATTGHQRQSATIHQSARRRLQC